MRSLISLTLSIAAAMPIAAIAIENGELDPNFGQNGTADINALTGATNASCTQLLDNGDGLVVGCILDGVAALVSLNANGQLNSFFGQKGIAVLPPTGLFDDFAPITALGRQEANIVVVRVKQDRSLSLCSNLTLVTAVTNLGQNVPFYGGFAFGYRIFELEPASLQTAQACEARISDARPIGMNNVSVTFPLGPNNMVPALASLDRGGSFGPPFGPLTRIPEFRFIGAVIPYFGGALIGGNDTAGTLFAVANSQGALISTWSLTLPSVPNLHFRDVAEVLEQFAPVIQLRILSRLGSASNAGLAVTATNFNMLDLNFNATQTLGPNLGHAIIPTSVFPASTVGFDSLLMDDFGNTVIFSSSLSSTRMLRLTKSGELDPEFRSGTQPGVVILNTAQGQFARSAVLAASARSGGINQISYLTIAASVSGSAVQSRVSRLRGYVFPSPIFKDGFEP